MEVEKVQLYFEASFLSSKIVESNNLLHNLLVLISDNVICFSGEFFVGCLNYFGFSFSWFYFFFVFFELCTRIP